MKHRPTRGEIWLIHRPQAFGGGRCCQPVIVVSSPAFDSNPIRIVVPLIAWRTEFEGKIDKFRIEASKRNGLSTEFAADYIWVTSVPTECFVNRKGSVDAEQIEEIAAGIAIAVDYRPYDSYPH